MARPVVRRRARAPKLPEGVTPGRRMPGGPMIYIADRPEPGVVLLRRWTIGFGPTAHPRVERGVRARARGENPFAGRGGWNLHAMGPKAEAERGLTGPDAASRLRHWFVQLPAEQRVSLRPAGFLPPGDPLRAPGTKFRQWVSDECIVTLVRIASQGDPRVKGLLFAVQARQTEMIPETRQKLTTYPIQELHRVFEQNGAGCTLRPPAGVTLEQAAKALGYPDLRKPISVAPEKLYESWRARVSRATEAQRLLLNIAYHRILLHRFLQRRRLTPRLFGTEGRREVGAEVERRANLMQAYRVFVFDRRGCPVGINVPLLEVNNLQVKALLDRKIPHADFTRSEARARKFGAWLFTDVLNKRISECRPTGIQGLRELLAAADSLG